MVSACRAGPFASQTLPQNRCTYVAGSACVWRWPEVIVYLFPYQDEIIFVDFT